MNVRSRQEYVNTRADRCVQSVRGALKVVLGGTGQGGDDRARNCRCHGFHRHEVAVRGDGKPSLNHVHPEAVELQGKAHLLVHVHAATGRLLAVAQSGVKYRDPGVTHANPPTGILLILSMLCGMKVEAKLIIFVDMLRYSNRIRFANDCLSLINEMPRWTFRSWKSFWRWPARAGFLAPQINSTALSRL